MAKQKKVKYKVGQFVYSHQNPTEKRPINRIRISDDGDYDHAYRLTLSGNDGFPKNSKWIDEKGLSLKKRTKK